MSQLMPLLLTVSCFSKIQIGFILLVPAHMGSPGKRAVKRVCKSLTKSYLQRPYKKSHDPLVKLWLRVWCLVFFLTYGVVFGNSVSQDEIREVIYEWNNVHDVM